jgi:hypothetical protein
MLVETKLIEDPDAITYYKRALQLFPERMIQLKGGATNVNLRQIAGFGLVDDTGCSD